MSTRFMMRGAGLGLVICVSLLAFFVHAQQQGMEVSGFRVPEYDEQGQMVYQLFGDHALLESDGMVTIEEVRVEFYREGDVFMEVTSPHCFYDKNRQEVRSDAPLRSEIDGVQLSGAGYILDTEARTVHVLQDSRLVFQDSPQQSGPAVSNETVITSTELFIDYTDRKARFTEAVQIQNEETSLTCGLLDVFFNENNEIEQVVANSDVTIVHQEAIMACEKLNVFFRENNKIKWAVATSGVHLSQGEDMGLESEKLNVFFNDNNEMERAIAESQVRLTNTEWKVAASRGTLMVQDRTALLEGEVQVESKELNMACNTLNLSFDESNEINWIEALGEVKILHEGREAHAGKAVYEVKTDEFLLEDNPKLIDGKNMLMGHQIRFWRTSGRMVCEPARAVIFPDEKFNTELFEN